tara:strand:- start:48 stop:377 length:330 start_codon:yes stop_codon:yes gene_type:complete
MGVYTEVDIYATFKTEQEAEKHIDNLEDNVIKFIEVNTEMDGNFSFGFNDCDLDGNVIIIKLSSGRYQHAEWQTEQLLAYLKTTDGLIEFNAEATRPENFLWWSIDEEE